MHESAAHLRVVIPENSVKRGKSIFSPREIVDVYLLLRSPVAKVLLSLNDVPRNFYTTLSIW